MRRGLLVLLAPLTFSATVAAQTQVIDSGVAGDRIVVSTKAEVMIARLTPEDVVSRMLTFDQDRDGKLAESELAERMQPLMARGDRNRDGALDSTEIRELALVIPVSPFQALQGRHGGAFGGSYGFADETSFSSRNHIEGAIEDLKLAADAREQALSIAKTFVDAVEADAVADLGKELDGVLSRDQLDRLLVVIKTPARAMTVRTQNGTDSRVIVLRGLSPQNQLRQFALSSDAQKHALQAVDRYVARVKMTEAERTALVNQLKGVLNVEERDNLRAALARRPVVASGTVFIDSARAGFSTLVEAVGN